MVLKQIKKPDINSEEFAEFYGIMLGDGCVYSNLTGICVSCDSLMDREYIMEYVPQLIEKLFGFSPKLYPYYDENRAIRCILYSKELTIFMKNLGFPIGIKKEGNAKIPEFIMSNESLLKRCIRGMVDTDGSVCPHPNTKIMVDLTIRNNPKLLDSTIKAFENLGIKTSNSKRSIVLYGDNKVGEYFDKISSSNAKHIMKYDEYTLTGRTPRTKEIESFLRKNKKK